MAGVEVHACQEVFVYASSPGSSPGWVLKSVQATVSASEISPTQELNELWNALPVEDVVELKHFIEHYAIAHGLP